MSATEAQPQVTQEIEPGSISSELSAQENLANFNKFVLEGGVPSVDQIAAAEKYAEQNVITKQLKGKDGKKQVFYFDKEGNQLDSDQVSEFRYRSNPETWIMDKETKTEAKALIKTDTFNDLSFDQKKVLKEVRDSRATGKSLKATYKELKKEAQDRLTLSNELKALKKAKAIGKNVLTDLGIDDLGLDVNAAGKIIANPSKRFVEVKSKHGKGSSQLSQIIEQQDFIRENAPELSLDLAPVESSRNLPTRPDGTILTKEEVEIIKSHEGEIRAGLAEHAQNKKEYEAELPDMLNAALMELSDRVDARIATDADLSDEEYSALVNTLYDLANKYAVSRGWSKDSEEYKDAMEPIENNLKKQAERLDEHESKMMGLTKDYFDSWKTLYTRVYDKAGINWEGKDPNKKSVYLSRKGLDILTQDLVNKFYAIADAKGWEEGSDEFEENFEAISEQIDDLWNLYENSRTWKDAIKDGHEKLGKWFRGTFFEGEHKNRNKVIALGALATAGYLTYRFGFSGGGSGHHAAHQATQGSGAPHPAAPVPSGAETHAAQTVTLQPGSNPWNVSEQILHQRGILNPTNAQIESLDAQIGAANGFPTWELWRAAATHLPAGTQLLIPS